MSITNRRTEGNKGSDLSYRGRVLKGLQTIADNTHGSSGLASAISALTSAVIAHQEFEIKIVRDPNNGDALYQQIREYDETTGTWSTTYTDVTGAVVVPSVEADLEYLDADGVLNLVLTELQNLNTKFTAATVTPGYTRNVNTTGTVLAGGREVSFFNAGSDDCTVLGAVLAAGEAITFTAGGEGDTLAAIAWTANTSASTTLLITEIR